MLYGHLLLVIYVTFLLWYNMHICLLTYTWYYLICEILNKEYGILTEYYGMLRF